KAVVHTSGAHSIDVLRPLVDVGAMTGSLHPALPFAQATITRQQTSGATFAVEATHPQLRLWLQGLVSAVDGIALELPDGAKARYHAALVIASNYTVTLYAAAQHLLMEIGASADVAANTLNPLMQATIHNVMTHGIPNALTGPLVRHDVGTVQTHLDALHGLTDDGQLAAVYRQLARLTYPLLTARGVETEALEMLFQQDEQRHALKHP
ncbi:MAG: DUF2520 domain-containing protein, partial [Armatimonadetes bacterium]|nr:DUF2520 domain-containing protein [Anaerolineae bacterium]